MVLRRAATAAMAVGEAESGEADAVTLGEEATEADTETELLAADEPLRLLLPLPLLLADNEGEGDGLTVA